MMDRIAAIAERIAASELFTRMTPLRLRPEGSTANSLNNATNSGSFRSAVICSAMM